jgi:hypothetical protein
VDKCIALTTNGVLVHGLGVSSLFGNLSMLGPKFRRKSHSGDTEVHFAIY